MRSWIYVDCPVCHERVLEPAYRYCGVDVRLHRASGKPPCRIAILPDRNGADHHAYQLPSGMSLEDGIEWAERKRAVLNRRAA